MHRYRVTAVLSFFPKKSLGAFPHEQNPKNEFSEKWVFFIMHKGSKKRISYNYIFHFSFLDTPYVQNGCVTALPPIFSSCFVCIFQNFASFSWKVISFLTFKFTSQFRSLFFTKLNLLKVLELGFSRSESELSPGFFLGPNSLLFLHFSIDSTGCSFSLFSALPPNF